MKTKRSNFRQHHPAVRPRSVTLKHPTPGAHSAPARRRSGLAVKSILVPVDFSSPSKKALDFAIPLARQFKAKLTLVHVVEPIASPEFIYPFPLAIENDKIMTECEIHLQKLAKQRRIPRGMLDQTLVRFGRSFTEITDAARSLKIDLIVISTHGYTGFKRALLGSTTERVVRCAPCPVLVVRERERELLPSFHS